ncbi:unnamed protein product [Amoebophrya sp. A25]|nr:unnamed protein product [Amoebophrya sp. A25]|eukprot:GSA25T00022333001.1
MQHKQMCHKAIVDAWISKGGLDFSAAPDYLVAATTSTGATSSSQHTRRRKLYLDSPQRDALHRDAFQRRLDRRNVRRLMSRERKFVAGGMLEERRSRQLQSTTSAYIHPSVSLRTAGNDSLTLIPPFNDHPNATQLCGDEYGELCPCDPIVDGDSCIGGTMNGVSYFVRLPAAGLLRDKKSSRGPGGSANVEDYIPDLLNATSQDSIQYPTDVAPPCPDFTDIQGQILEKLTMKANVAELTQHDINLHAQALALAIDPETAFVDFSKLSPIAADLFEELVTRPCVPLKMLQKMTREMTIRQFPVDLYEAEQACLSGKMRCHLLPAEITRPTFAETVYMETAGLRKEGNLAANAETFDLAQISDFRKQCEESEEPTDADYCLMAKNILGNVGNKCGSSIEMNRLTAEDLHSLATPRGGAISELWLQPDREGFVTVPQCAVYFGLVKRGMTAEDAMDFCLLKTRVPGKVAVRDLETPSPADAVAQAKNGCPPPASGGNEANLLPGIGNAVSIAESENVQEESTLGRRQREGMLKAREQISALFEDDLYSSRRRRRLAESTLESDKVNGADILQLIQNSEPVSLSEQGLHLEEVDAFVEMISDLKPVLLAQHTKLERTLNGVDTGVGVNYLAGTASSTSSSTGATVQHSQMDEYLLLNATVEICDAASSALNRAAGMLRTLEHDARNTTVYATSTASSYYSISYLPDTTRGAQMPGTGAAHPDRLTVAEEKGVAKCVTELLNLPERGIKKELAVCVEDYVSSATSNQDESLLLAEWDALTEGCAADPTGCVEKSCFDKPPKVLGSTLSAASGGSSASSNGPPVSCHLEDPNAVFEVDAPLIGSRRSRLRRQRRRRRQLREQNSKSTSRALAPEDTTIPSEVNAIGQLTPLPLGHPLTADCYFIQTGCMPHQVDFHSFKREIFDLIAEGSANNAQAGAVYKQGIEDILLAGGGGKTLLTDSEVHRALNAGERLMDQRQGNCMPSENCDPYAADASVSEDEIAQLFNFLDKAGTGCIDPPVDDTFDCDSLGPSDLSMVEDADDDGTPDSSVISAPTTLDGEYTNSGAEKLHWPALCREAKQLSKKKKKLDMMMEKMLERSGNAAARATLRRKLSSTIVGLVGDGADLHESDGSLALVRRLAGQETTSSPGESTNHAGAAPSMYLPPGVIFQDPLTGGPDHVMQALTSPSSGSTPGSTTSPSSTTATTCKEYREAMLLPGVSTASLTLLRQTADECEHRIDRLRKDVRLDVTLLSNVLAAEASGNETQAIRNLVEDLAMGLPGFGTAFDYAEACSKIPSFLGYNTGADSDGDTLNDPEELAHCLIKVKDMIMDVDDHLLKRLQQLRNGGANLKELMREIGTFPSASAAQAEKREMARIPTVCYEECADPHPADRPTPMCQVARTCELLQKRGSPEKLQDGRRKQKQSRRLRRRMQMLEMGAPSALVSNKQLQLVDHEVVGSPSWTKRHAFRNKRGAHRQIAARVLSSRNRRHGHVSYRTPQQRRSLRKRLAKGRRF